MSRSSPALPEDLRIEVELREQVRHRGIYDALVYIADVRLRGRIDTV